MNVSIALKYQSFDDLIRRLPASASGPVGRLVELSTTLLIVFAFLCAIMYVVYLFLAGLKQTSTSS
jgi:hypothetical protein